VPSLSKAFQPFPTLSKGFPGKKRLFIFMKPARVKKSLFSANCPFKAFQSISKEFKEIQSNSKVFHEKILLCGGRFLARRVLPATEAYGRYPPPPCLSGSNVSKPYILLHLLRKTMDIYPPFLRPKPAPEF
jgi:hypothetical protein